MLDLAARISTRFIKVMPGDLEPSITRALEEAGLFIGADRCQVFLWTEEGATAECAYEWSAAGIDSKMAMLKNLPAGAFPWWLSKLSRQETIVLPRVADLPAEAAAERTFIQAMGTKSIIAVPLAIGETLRGFMSFAAVGRENEWTDVSVDLLQLVGQIFIGTIERSRIENALRESETKYRTLVDKSLPGIYITQNHVLKFCNSTFAEMFGYRSPEEMTGSDVKEIIADESWEDVDREVRLRESGEKEVARYEITARRRDGTLFQTEVLGSRIDYEGRPAVQGMIIDITERKNAEKLQDSLFRISETSRTSSSLDELFRSLHAIIAELMPARNFYIALLNPADGLVSFPYFVDEFDAPPRPQKPGRRMTDYVLRTGAPILVSPERFEELREEGEVEPWGTASIDWLGVPLVMEGRTRGVLVVQSYTPGVRYGEAEKNILKFVSGQVAQAIARKQAETELSERERFLSGIFDSIQDGLSVLDMDYTILRVNKAMESWYAHVVPLVGKKCYQAYQLRQIGCDVCPTRRTYATGQAAKEVVAMVGEGGKVTGWIDLYSFPLVDRDSGQMKGVIEYVRDTTEQHRAEQALKSSLREKEVLLREVHHRVKNNMQVISSLLSLQSSLAKDTAASDIFSDSQRRIRSMALVHERLYRSPDLSRIEFSSYLRSLAVQLFNSFRLDPARVRVRVEAEEVFLNINTAIPCGLICNELLSNAFKHAFPEGRSGEALLRLRCLETGHCELEIGDDGVGLPDGLDWRNASTMGMQVVAMLAAQLEGTVELLRKKGAAFRVLFKEVSIRPLNPGAGKVQ